MEAAVLADESMDFAQIIWRGIEDLIDPCHFRSRFGVRQASSRRELTGSGLGVRALKRRLDHRPDRSRIDGRLR